VEKGDEAVVRALLERGANVKLQDKDGESMADRVWIQSADHHDDGENGSMRRIFPDFKYSEGARESMLALLRVFETDQGS
jgi:hypothetical protein